MIVKFREVNCFVLGKRQNGSYLLYITNPQLLSDGYGWGLYENSILSDIQSYNTNFIHNINDYIGKSVWFVKKSEYEIITEEKDKRKKLKL